MGLSKNVRYVCLGQLGLADDVGEVLEGNESAVLRELERLGGSSGGARPKVHVALDDSGRARADDGGARAYDTRFRVFSSQRIELIA